jgi:hypothetical protein
MTHSHLLPITRKTATTMTRRNPRVFPTLTSKLQLSLIEIHKTRSILASTSWGCREERATMSLESVPETISINFWRRRK